jgi:hypothetical protein
MCYIQAFRALQNCTVPKKSTVSTVFFLQKSFFCTTGTILSKKIFTTSDP